jgi:RecA/RadA recombinase
MKGLIDKLVKKFDNENIIKFSEKDAFKDMKSWAHTGSPTLDFNLGTFGLPQGIVEIAGVSRGGKTTLALEAMKNFQRENPETAVCVILSSENRDNKDYAKRIGVDVNNVLIVKITFVEEMFLLVKQIIDATNDEFKANKIKEQPKFFFMWDSLGATLSMSERETLEENNNQLTKKLSKGETLSELKHEKIGAFAKEAKKFAKFILAEMYNKVIHFVMLNHTYDTITGMGISTKKSTGGEWVQYMPTLRLQLAQRGMEKLDDEEVAQISTVKVIKNDFGSRKKTDIRILLGEGIILSQDDIDYALESGILKKEGAKKVTFMNGKLSWSSPREFFNLYHERNKFLPILHRKIQKAMQSDLLAIKAKYNGEEMDNDAEVDDEEE